MKKQFSNILAVALMTLVVSACTQDALELTPGNGGSAKPQGKQITLTFQAEDPVTKTEYSDGGLDSKYDIYWSDGDAIGIYGVNVYEYPNRQYNLSAGAGRKNGNFANPEVTWTANTATDQDPYRFYAYYPYDAMANQGVTSLAHTKVAIKIPGVQVQDGPNSVKHVGKYRYSVASKVGTNNEGVFIFADQGFDVISGLLFKNVTSAFKLTPKNLPSGVRVTSITLTSLESGASFSIRKGTMDLTKVEAGVEEVLNVEESDSFLTLKIENGGLGNGEFGFLVVNPLVKNVHYEITYTLSDGRTLKRKNASGNTQHTAPATGFDPSFRYVAELDYNNSEEIIEYTVISEHSNCHMVKPDSWYQLDARFKGNSSTESIGNGVSAEAIWNTGELGSVNYKDGFITFQSGYKPSNALIAVKDASGNILWSWHIWVSPLDKTSDVTVNGYGTFMSLNLGALSATTDLGGENQGLYYQWGRKDPMFAQNYTPDFSANPGFTGNDNGSTVNDYDNAANLLAKSIANPTTYYQYWTGSALATSSNTTTEWVWQANYKTDANKNNSVYGIKSRGRWTWYEIDHFDNSENVGNPLFGYYTTTALDNSWGYTGAKEGSKTIYDPCPVGYRVPTSEELAFLISQRNFYSNGLKFAITGLLLNDIFVYMDTKTAQNNITAAAPGDFQYLSGLQGNFGSSSYNSNCCYLWTSSVVDGIKSGAVNVIMTADGTYHKSSSSFEYNDSNEYLKSCGRAIPVRCIAE